MPSTPNPLHGFQVDRARIRTIGRDLQRPECVLAERDGTLAGFLIGFGSHANHDQKRQ